MYIKTDFVFYVFEDGLDLLFQAIDGVTILNELVSWNSHRVPSSLIERFCELIDQMRENTFHYYIKVSNPYNVKKGFQRFSLSFFVSKPEVSLGKYLHVCQK